MTQAGLSFLSGFDMATFVAGYTFVSPVNGNVTFNNDSDRIFSYKMKSLDLNSGKFDVSWHFIAS